MIPNRSLESFAQRSARLQKKPEIGALAQKCIEKSPPHHSLYTHTVRKRTYIFSIADTFVIIGIFDQDLNQSEALVFLNRLRCDLRGLMELGRSRMVDISPSIASKLSLIRL
ncbi:putative Longin-like domain-containing protein [Rosa chinensis]|uniref:Putative Longin-like domain-containing protein n=1 Tax=Rosa chinensis TaxID=74649 RepID=A0A2P6RSR9_ROSCH|nr:putative Longin-like domain-containing protein [Rosa chinensis]